MALFHAQHTLPQGSLHYRLATLGYQRYNAYSVDKYVLIYYSWHDSFGFQRKRITIEALIQTKKLFINHQCHRFYVNIPMNTSTIADVVTI